VTSESGRTYAWIGIVVDLLLIAVGAWLVSRGGGWRDVGEVLVGVCVVGLVVSTVQLWRGRRPTAG
jgi:hypothetical protein